MVLPKRTGHGQTEVSDVKWILPKIMPHPRGNVGGTSPKKLMKTQEFLKRGLRPKKQTTHKSPEVIETYQICKVHTPTPKGISAERTTVERSLADLLSWLQAV